MRKGETIPTNCLFFACGNPELKAEIKVCKDKCYAYNQLNPNDRTAQRTLLASLLGNMGDDVTIMPPFWCDYGYNISIGSHFYSNHNMIITDGAKVTFGDHVFIAPNCVLPLPNTQLTPCSACRAWRLQSLSQSAIMSGSAQG